MKNILTVVALLFISISSFSQIKEGHVKFKIDIESNNPEMQMQVAMLQNSKLDLFFNNKTTRSEFAMGTIMTMITVANAETDQLLMLMSGMVGKQAIKTTITEINKKKPEDAINVKLVDETKTILGFKCNKALITDAEGNESVFWYTSEIEVDKKGQSMFSEKIPGFALEYEMSQQGLKMTMTAVEVDKKLDKKQKELFDLVIPTDYKEITLEDLNSIGK